MHQPLGDLARPLLSAVIVTYRRPRLLESCLSSVRAAVEALAVPTEVIVVDNGSQDETGEMVRTRFPEVRLLTIPDNVGFTPAVMRGIRVAAGEWIALLNDDVTLESNAFRALVDAGRDDPVVGAVAAQVRFADRPAVINSAGIEVDCLGVATDRLLGQSVDGSDSEPVEVFGVSGGAALYRRSMLDRLGGFDESFFAYLEDVDLAWRARMHGWRAVHVPKAIVYHHHSATFGHRSTEKYFLVGRNRVRLVAKNATRRQLLRHGLSILLYDLAYITYVLVRHHTLAPVRGRLAGVREWRRYRQAGAADRRPVELSPPFGFIRAFQRDRAWSAPHTSP